MRKKLRWRTTCSSECKSKWPVTISSTILQSSAAIAKSLAIWQINAPTSVVAQIVFCVVRTLMIRLNAMQSYVSNVTRLVIRLANAKRQIS